MSIIDFMIGGLVVIITLIFLHGAFLIVYDKQKAWERKQYKERSDE